MPSLNIYVPDDLKVRMDDMDELDNTINWSSVAQRAFEIEINRAESRKETKTMGAVVERLRASKAVDMAVDAEAGKDDGRDWAMQDAEYKELKRLSEYEEAAYVDPLWVVVGQTLYADDDHDAEDYREFWERRFGTLTPPDEVVRGFIEGAKEVWFDVGQKVDGPFGGTVSPPNTIPDIPTGIPFPYFKIEVPDKNATPPARPDSKRYLRWIILLTHHGKTVADYYKACREAGIPCSKNNPVLAHKKGLIVLKAPS